MKTVLVLLLMIFLAGCAAPQKIREISMEKFDTFKYTYERVGNVITRELHAKGTEKIVPETDLIPSMPGVP